MKTEFEWDPEKAAANKLKHGVSFQSAIRTFHDPHCLLELERHMEGEERWQTVGMADGQFLLMVVHTNYEFDDLEIVRIISARLATNPERRRYEKNRYGSI